MNTISLKAGILIGQLLPDLDIDDFSDMESLRLHINKELNINILPEMFWDAVIKELKK